MEKTYGFKIRSVTMDRHIQIRAFLEKVCPDIIHQFDVWHVSKSIKKELSRKLVKCEKLAKCSKSIINHFWSCCRTCESDQKLLKKKWVSLLFHIRKMHLGNWQELHSFKQMCSSAIIHTPRGRCWVIGSKFSRFSSIRGDCVGQRFIKRSRQVDRILPYWSNWSFSLFK